MIKNNGPNEPPLPPDGDGGSPRKMLSEKQVLQILPVSRSTLWRMERQGKFPHPRFQRDPNQLESVHDIRI
jgi:hypothetical protein